MKIMSQIPADLRYTEDDEWVRVEGDEVVVGITDHAQDALSDIVFLELPDVGSTFGAGDTFGVVESVKAAADLFMPVAGEVTAVNTTLTDTPELLNTDPYGAAWMLRLRPDNMADVDALMDGAAYEKHLAEKE
jgi:glycine cleavage system H protein